MGINKKRVDGNKSVSSPRIEAKSYDYPLFCFKHLHKDYHIDKCSSKEKQCLLDQIVKISQTTWQVLQCSNRHGLGCEKINTGSIKCEIPESLKSTVDVNFLLSFRFDGLKAFVGFRDRFIFHILFIDRDFTLYDH